MYNNFCWEESLTVNFFYFGIEIFAVRRNFILTSMFLNYSEFYLEFRKFIA